MMPFSRRGERHPAIASGFIACAMILGGGGSPNPVTEILLQLLCVFAALAWLWLPGEPGASPLPSGRAPWLLAALVLLVPILQLTPLPPTLWRSLPGQGDRVAALALVGTDSRWHPLTLSVPRTLAALLALVPPILVLLAIASLNPRGRARVIWAIAGVGLLAALFGGLQVSLGSAAPRLYAENNGGLTGFQANKNAAADVLLIGMVAAVAALTPSLAGRSRGVGKPRMIANRRAAWSVLAGAVAVMLLGTVLTNSRAGILLIPLALVGCWAVLAAGGAAAGRRRWLPALALALVAALIGLAVLAEGSRALGPVFARFGEHDAFRRELWRDAWFAVRRSWPTGLGLGGAQPALIAVERLEIVDPSVPNRVHNDYLEFLLEGGAAAVAVLVCALAALLLAATKAWRDPAADRSQIAVGFTILLIVACHSLVDYPLRSMALACLTGVGGGLLLAPPARSNVAETVEATANSREFERDG